MRNSVVAVGNVVADFIAASIGRFPNWGEHVEAKETVQLNIGGNAANFAVCLAKLGVPTALVGKVGRDPLGQTLLDLLRKAKVDISQVSLCDIPTSISLIASNLQGERGIIHYIGSNASLTHEDVTAESLGDADILHLCAYYLMPGLKGESSERVLKKAKGQGLTTTFDVAWDINGSWRMGGILEFVDFFLPNEKEAAMITGKTDPIESSKSLIEMGAKNVVIKLGPRGCLIRASDGDTMEIPAYRVPVVDTTGAGDAFDAGFVYGLLENWSLKKIGRFANAVAALTLAKPSGTGSAPCLSDALTLSQISHDSRVRNSKKV